MSNVTSLAERRAKAERAAISRQYVEPAFSAFLVPCEAEGAIVYRLCVQTPIPESQVILLFSDDATQIIDTEPNIDHIDEGTIFLTIKAQKAIFHYEFCFLPDSNTIQCAIFFDSPINNPNEVLISAWCSYGDGPTNVS